LVELIKAVIAYKDELIKIFGSNRISELQSSGNNLSNDELTKIRQSQEYSDEDKEYLIKFASDFKWWKGGKNIGRNDFWNSPVLGTANVVNDSQGFIATIADYLAENPNVNELLKGVLQKKDNCNSSNSNELSLQQIYYGAPGTGKSHKIKKFFEDNAVPESNIFRTTFHPDSDYSTFVGAYKPTMQPVPANFQTVQGRTEEIVYEFIPQAFMQAYICAYEKPTENVYLVIEEINRGNCAQIFGDLFQLLDRDESGKSEYNIKADADLCNFLKKKLGQENDGIKDDELCLPPNLYIWATMNTSDQSLFPIDSAFKRRWDWEYRPINYSNTTWTIKIGELNYSWTDFQKKINEKIYSIDNSEDKQLGDYFVNPRDGIISADTLLNKILFYLWNDVCKDDSDGIFKIKTTQSEEGIKFSEFFGEDKDMKLQELMAYIGVKPITDNQEDGEVESSEESNVND
jgi:hypothetical protein